MADISGGRIVWKLDVDSANFEAQMARAGATANGLGGKLTGLSSTATSLGASFRSFASQMGGAFDSAASSIASVGSKIAIAGAVGAGALALMANASLNMVMSVQRSTLALATYTGSATEAAGVTKELVDFAKSPKGVLFNRDELLQSAVLLKGAGVETQNLTRYIKAMAPAVAVSGAKFSEIAQILSKVVSTGKLGAEEFDQLAIRGIVLDRSLRGTAVSAEQLFAALQEKIPDSNLEKYARTVEGLKIRFVSAFRELGNSLLGVQYGADELGASFVSGGLGDAASKGIVKITEALKSPEAVSGIKAIGDSLGKALTWAVDVGFPAMMKAIVFVAQNFDTIVTAVAALVPAFVAAKVAALGFNIVAAANPFTLIAFGIVALIAGITFLVLKFGLLDNIIRTVKGAFDFLWPILVGTAAIVMNAMAPAFRIVVDAARQLWVLFQTYLVPAIMQLWTQIQPFIPQLKLMAVLFGIVIVSALVVFVVAVMAVVAVIGLLVFAFAKGMGMVMGIVGDSWGFVKSVFNSMLDGINIFVTNAVNIFQGIMAIPGIVSRAFGQVVSFIGSLLANAHNIIRGAISGFISAGRDIIGGIMSGLRAAAGDIPRFLQQVGIDAIAAVKKILHIGSPSKLFAAQVGVPISQGIAMGIMQGAVDISRALGNVTSPISSGGVDMSSSVAAGGAGNTTIIIEQSGIMTDSKQGIRRVFKEGIEVVNEELRSRGVGEIGGGRLTETQQNG